LELGRANPQADQLQNGSKREVTERQGHDASGTQVRTVQFYMVTVRLQETANAGEALARARSAQTHSSGHLRQKPTPEPPAEDRQPATFMIGQSQSSPAQLRLQNPVFCSEVLDAQHCCPRAVDLASGWRKREPGCSRQLIPRDGVPVLGVCELRARIGNRDV